MHLLLNYVPDAVSTRAFSCFWTTCMMKHILAENFTVLVLENGNWTENMNSRSNENCPWINLFDKICMSEYFLKNQLVHREPEMSTKFSIIIISYDIVELPNVWYWSPIYQCSRSMEKFKHTIIFIFIIRRITLRWWSFLK